MSKEYETVKRNETWFDDFLKSLKEKGIDPTLPGTVDVLQTFQIPQGNGAPSADNVRYVFDQSLFGDENFDPETPISKLNDEQKDVLFALTSNSQLFVKAPTTDPMEYFTPYNDVHGNFEKLDPLDTAHDALQDSPQAQETIQDFKKQLQSGFDKNPGLQDCLKTITDVYKDAKIEELAATGLIQGRNNEPISIGRGKRPFEKYTVLLDNFNSQQGVYLQNLDKKETVQIKRTVDGRIQKTPRESLLVNKKVKDDAIKQFIALSTQIKNVKSENAQFKKLANDAATIAEELKRTVHRDDFIKKIEEFAENADKYYMGKVGAKMNKKGMEALDITSKIRGIRDAVKEDIVPSEDVKGEYLSLKEVLAGKYVRTYAATVAKHAKSPAMLKTAEFLKNDPKVFNRAVKDVMNSKTFLNMYGGVEDPESIKRMKDALNLKPSDLFKSVQKEIAHPKAERDADALEYQKAMQTTKRPSVTTNMQHGPVSPELKDDLAHLVTDMKSELMRSRGYGTRSKEYEHLMEELTIAEIRFSRGNNFMDVRAQMAEIAKAAEAFQNKELGRDFWNNSRQKNFAAEKLLQGFKAMDRNELPSKTIASDLEVKKTLLAKNIVEASAVNMMNTDILKLKTQGHRIKTDPQYRDQQVKKLMESDAFKILYGDDAAAVDKALKRAPEEVLNKIVKEQKELIPKIAKEIKKDLGLNKEELKKVAPEGEAPLIV